MRLSVHPSLILWISILFFMKASLLAPFLLAAALHELGHAWALWVLGHPVRSVSLSFTGAEMTTETLSYRDELLAAAAGPAVNLICSLLLPVWPAFGCYSLMLGLFNLLPLWGLDGGRILRCALLLRLPHSSAYRVCRTVEIAAALALWGGAVYLSLGLSCGIWPLFIGAMFLYRAAENAFSDS